MANITTQCNSIYVIIHQVVEKCQLQHTQTGAAVRSAFNESLHKARPHMR